MDKINLLLAKISLSANDLNVPNFSGKSTNVVIKDVMLTVYFWAGVVAVVAIVISGFMYVISTGSADKVNKSKNALIASIIGLTLVLFAYAITSLVIGIVGK